ncbi:glycosyltransferase family 4 protein [Flavobacterium sp. J49]|uniref:glycosyltransferase family 4 protein n=1 Tax=Flavobacterium sp. J49 TaxID=2718534 RepID=UPI001592B4A2|nr:glycosyltransferase family 4 protein [Flavobacterium sp. J49]MBF6639982.1 glycosyltransferase family 4 protein [Flavobacterium sp. J49]NIC01227.1 glycosyltransferase family 4 protein [Flavobacterium sp. J49]
MKIAFLTSEYPHAKTGFSAGIGTSILNLSKGLLQLGHQVTIVIYGQDQDETFTDAGLTFYKIKNRKLKGFSRILTQKKIQKRINDLVDKGEIDIVEAADWTGITSNIQLKCPLVIKLHGSDTYFCHLDQRPVKFLNKFREKKALQNADAWLSVSQYTATVTKELLALSNDFTVIPNGIDLDDFSVAATNNNTEEDTILYFGTLIRKKGSLELPLIFNEVYKQNKQAKLVLIGRDAADITTGNSSVWAMMQPLFDADAFQNVTYLGSVPYDQMKTHINASTVCVFPTFAEALPVSWIEAMAMQKAIVASEIGWAKEVIDDGVNGFLVNPKAHQAYAEKINALLENASLRNQIGTAAKAKVQQKFSIQVVAQQSAAFYQKLIR